VRGEISSLPLRDRAFDLVLSGLALGHAVNLAACLAEIARVLRPDGVLLYSDFHPEALRRGQTRSFVDATGAKVSLPAGQHDRAAHLDGLRAAGLLVECLDEPRVGFEFDQPFAGGERFYSEWRGVPMLLIVQARKRA
jgi:malonyl-CoA O-methyltransferase